MNEQNRSDSLLEMARGAILERVDYEAARVAENIEDPNTDFKAKRKIGSRTMLATAPIRTVVMPILAKPRPVMKAFGPRMSCTKTVPIAQRRMSSPFR